MKISKKFLAIMLALVLVFSLNQVIVFAANTYDSGTLTIDTQWTGSLESYITSLEVTLTDIKTLNMTAGELTDDDVTWLTINLSGLEHISITGNAFFTPEEDGITCVLPDGAFGNYSPEEYTGHLGNLKTAVIDVADNYRLEFGASAFDECHVIESISIPEAYSFGIYAFYSNYVLSSLNIPNVTSFGKYSFDECDALTSIYLPNLVTMDEEPFYDCSALVSVNLPKLTTIGLDSFWDCGALTEVYLPSLTTIGNNAFRNCSTTITLTLGTTVPPVIEATFIGYPPMEYHSIVAVPRTMVSAYDQADGEDDNTWYGWTIEGRNTECLITAFSINGQIISTINESTKTIEVVMPYGTNLTSLSPVMTISENATGSPASGTAQDFSNTVKYKITSEYGNFSEYTVRVTTQAQPPVTTTTTPTSTVTTNTAPLTGDMNMIFLYFGAMSASLIVFGALKKRKYN